MKKISTLILIFLLKACAMQKLHVDNSNKKTFLAVYDYGMGGIWLLIDARSITEIKSKYPKLIAYEDKPEWMTSGEKAEYVQHIKRINFHFDIDEKPIGWLADL